MEGWIMGLLSGPQTHAANVLSNALTATWMVSRKKARLMDLSESCRLRRIMSGKPTTLAYGLVNGFRDGLILASKALRSGKG